MGNLNAKGKASGELLLSSFDKQVSRSKNGVL